MKVLIAKIRDFFAKLWPKRRGAAERCCWSCKHVDSSFYVEPCCNCDNDHSEWEPQK